jgi:proteasome accessory factor A
MNEVTTLLKVGSADIVLRMIEAGVAMRDLSLENPIRAIREVSHDITGRRKVGWSTARSAARWRSSRSTSRRRASSSSAAAPTPPPSGCWICGAGAGRRRDGDLSGVEREIDWVSKLRLIERYQAKHDLACRTRGSRRWTWPTTTCAATGPLRALERKGAVDRVEHDLEIFEAKETPPQTTRAGLRASSSGTPRRSGATSPSTGCT